MADIKACARLRICIYIYTYILYIYILHHIYINMYIDIMQLVKEIHAKLSFALLYSHAWL